MAAAERAKMLGAEYVGKDAIVLDVGINVDENGKLCGDVDFESIQETASMTTLVPGGVGAVITAVLAKHLVQAALRKNSQQPLRQMCGIDVCKNSSLPALNAAAGRKSTSLVQKDCLISGTVLLP